MGQSLLSDRLQAARQRRFVGREFELELFCSAVTAEQLPFYVLHIYGPGGVGKTSLLREFARLAREEQFPVYFLDGYNMEATPASFLAALEGETKRLGDWRLGAEEQGGGGELTIDNWQLSIVNYVGRQVLIVDRYEAIVGLDRWLRQEFLPRLPDDVLVIFAGRQSPKAVWASDPGWRSLVKVRQLRNFSPGESTIYLTHESIPEEQQGAITRFTHGHPLALSLVAEIFAQRRGRGDDYRFEPEEATGVIHKLVERFMEDVPSAAYRAALEACALARQTGEQLLSAMVGQGPTAELQNGPTAEGQVLFNWLRNLSFIEQGTRGLWPHALAREALTADLRWRNPDWYGELHRRARGYYAERLQQTHGQTQQEVLIDYIFLHRDNPIVRPFFHQLQERQPNAPTLAADQFRSEDRQALLAMVEKHEGAAAAKLAAYWLERQPEGVTVYRDDQGQLAGFVMQLALDAASGEDLKGDPATAAACRYLEAQAPLRTGEKASYFRFWMAEEGYQTICPVQSLIFVQIVRHYLTTPGLAFSFLPCVAPQLWGAIFTYADLQAIAEADFEVGGRAYGVFGHDWRSVTPLAWLDLMAQRETAADPHSVARPEIVEPLLVLSQEEFATAVHEALRNLVRPDLLDDNPLLRSRVVGEGKADGRVERLQGVIREAAAMLEGDMRSRKFYRALYHAYLQPAATHEEAAELLDVPYGSFRRHLKRGVAEVTDILWQREIEG